ncbi:MAG: hypothetical protein J0H12_04280 [Candidatus Paracaedimonas acanthamoebae]|uniref:Diaminopimelate epimerase n=1 Tax=Candidatus Paracaedimonas acanthamoebae TaxID=244581 RepID=A0A8J7TUF8_9PROT|nr:hypothetical protein [Candidatus Paracaedimonas acanthamoebae]
MSNTLKKILKHNSANLANRYKVENIIYIKVVENGHSIITQILFFESDGIEFLFCGNGVLCTSSYLFSKYKVRAANYITSSSSVFSFEIKKAHKIYINMGRTFLPSLNYMRDEIKIENKICYGAIKELPININIGVTAYSFTVPAFYLLAGEPHLVIFESMLMNIINKKISDNAFYEALIGNPSLLYQIGIELNKQRWFLQGVNVNLAKIVNENTVQYNSFERGLYKETLACSTGATAIASVISELGLIQSYPIHLQPKVARQHREYQKLELLLNNKDGMWWLETTHPPRLVWTHA